MAAISWFFCFHFLFVGSWVDKILAELWCSHYLCIEILQLFYDLLPSGLCQSAKLSMRSSLIHPITNCIPTFLVLPIIFPVLLPPATYDQPTYSKSNLLIVFLFSIEYKVQDGRKVYLQSCNPTTWHSVGTQSLFTKWREKIK